MNKSPKTSEHPPENVLLRFVDGELDAKRAAAIREHLEACWQCRTETEELQETIRDYMHFHRKRIVPSIPRPPRYWHGFEGMLSQAVGESAAVFGWKSRLFTLHRLASRAVWIGAAAVACTLAAVVVLDIVSSRANIAKAAEVLHHAVLSDEATQPNPSRRVRIRFRGQAFVRNAGMAGTSSNNAIEPLFRSSQLDWSNPLSARSFAGWHDRLRAKSDQITFAPDRIAVETKTDEGDLRRASFTVRAADYHPIEESLDFGQAGRVDVTELPNEEFVAEPPSVAKPRVSSPTPSNRPISPLYLPDDVEANVRFLLHAIGADVREILSIQRSGGEIEVTGVVSDTDRRQEIMNRIGALDHVVVQIQSVQDLVSPTASQQVVPLGQGSEQNYDAPAKLWLEHQFPNAADRETFVHRALQLNRDISIRTYALSQLATRYTPANFNTLSPVAKEQIEHVVADLAAGINTDDEALRAHLQPLVTENVTANRVEPAPGTWQFASARCLTLTRKVDDSLTSLFAASPQPPGKFDSLVQQLRSRLSEVCRIPVE